MSFFDRAHTVAPPGYNRFLVPPAALAVHLSIGQAYAFSTFNLPLTRMIGITKSAPGDWDLTQVVLTFSLGIVFLGLSAALFGRWVERVGPRLAMFTAALLFSGGFMISAVALAFHWLWLLYLGYGVIGGCGLGIGYISPVSTLIKWFPDRPGMATGMAIMGFGGGAFIAAPLSTSLMSHFASATSTGVLPTFVVMGAIYFCFMMIGALVVKVPAQGWRPEGWVPAAESRKLVTTANVHVDVAWKTPQFILLWVVLCMNVTAGIAVLGQASPMIQEMFGVSPIAAGGFVGLLSLFNMLGRFFWASLSDYIGRRNTYMVFFVLGILLYAYIPSAGHAGSAATFVLACGIILSMYGGGFSTIPAYLRDVFGTMHVGAIHGRLLTAWSAAGILGPILITLIRDDQIKAGVAKADAYSLTLYIMCGLLAVGLISNLLMRPVSTDRHHQGDVDVASAH
ncbi:MAG TPA: OFA family MFS transporter [Stellaceae bacterium]|jgi:MFS family permease|nr:OFA family MFS transporter [Stellaceae bacterium]